MSSQGVSTETWTILALESVISVTSHSFSHQKSGTSVNRGDRNVLTAGTPENKIFLLKLLKSLTKISMKEEDP